VEPLLGHRAVVERLWGALRRDSLHHALLFEGPSGVGKRTVAIRLAMAANCTGNTAPPCGSCPSCRQILAGNHPDVLRVEPDAEKATATITVEQIREIVRQAGYHRYAGRRRVVIVDPAEAMLPAAANALLKTLEEPPAGTGFVLIANHASALLPTIVSRCQRYRFGPVPEAELTAWLEKRGLPEAARLARVSLGCPGRALELADGRLQARAELRGALLQALSAELGAVFELSQKLCEGQARQEWTRHVEDLIAVIEDLLRDVAITATGAALPLLNADAEAVVDRWREALWPDGVAVVQGAIAEARENLLANVHGRTLLDALLVRLRSELRLASA
jgi:DNA polymerase-3 subunit delta'